MTIAAHTRRIVSASVDTLGIDGAIYFSYCTACQWTIIDRLGTCNKAWDDHIQLKGSHAQR